MKRNIFLLMLCLFGLIGAMAQTKTAQVWLLIRRVRSLLVRP